MAPSPQQPQPQARPSLAALVVAPSSRRRQQDEQGPSPLESWLRASRALAGGAAFLVALAGAQVGFQLLEDGDCAYICKRARSGDSPSASQHNPPPTQTK